MKTFHLILAVLLSPLFVSAHAADAWQQDGKPAANTASMKSKAGFGAQLFLTQDTGVLQKWNTPEPPKIVPVTRARRDLPVITVLLFAGPGIDSSGRADVTCDFIAYNPDGSVYGKQLNAPVWKRAYLGKFGYSAFRGIYGHSNRAEGSRRYIQGRGERYTDHIKKVDLVLKATFQVPR